MYALVYSPNGIVGTEGSGVRLFETRIEAHAAMRRHLMSCVADEYKYDRDYADYGIDKNHAYKDGSCGDGAEWHIYEL